MNYKLSILIICITITALSCALSPLHYFNSNPCFEMYKKAEVLLADKDYDSALKFYKTLVTSYPQCSYADEAQFKIGFIYVCHRNKSINYDKALGAFENVRVHYPESKWTYEANNWSKIISLLHSNEKSANVEVDKESGKDSRLKVLKLNNIIEELRSELTQYGIDNQDLLEENEKLKLVLKKLEEIDKEY